jgi:hypothetical protein
VIQYCSRTKVEESVELVADDLGKVATTLEAVAFQEAQRGQVHRVHSSHHGVFLQISIHLLASIK